MVSKGRPTKKEQRIKAQEEKEREKCPTPPVVLPKKKKVRGRNKPKTLVDYRPHILSVLSRHPVLEQAISELEQYGHQLKIKERISFLLQCAKLGLESSPRTVEGMSQQVIILDSHGIIGKTVTPVHSEIDVTPIPPALAERLPHNSPRDQAVADAAQRERDRAEVERVRREGQVEEDGEVIGPSVIDVVNERLAREMAEEREAAMLPKIPEWKGVSNC